MLALAGAAWAGAGTGRWLGWWVVLVVAALAVGVWGLRRWSGIAVARTASGALLVLAATGTVTVLRLDQVGHGPVWALADERAAVSVVGTVRSDPRKVAARYG